jgi:hypothetical protein
MRNNDNIRESEESGQQFPLYNYKLLLLLLLLLLLPKSELLLLVELLSNIQSMELSAE